MRAIFGVILIDMLALYLSLVAQSEACRSSAMKQTAQSCAVAYQKQRGSAFQFCFDLLVAVSKQLDSG
jgi:hypothetical protein